MPLAVHTRQARSSSRGSGLSAIVDGMSECKNAIRHGPADGRGKCPWCRARITDAVSAPRQRTASDLTEAYGEHYDPDFGALSPDAIQRRYSMGQIA